MPRFGLESDSLESDSDLSLKQKRIDYIFDLVANDIINQEQKVEKKSKIVFTSKRNKFEDEDLILADIYILYDKIFSEFEYVQNTMKKDRAEYQNIGKYILTNLVEYLVNNKYFYYDGSSEVPSYGKSRLFKVFENYQNGYYDEFDQIISDLLNVMEFKDQYGNTDTLQNILQDKKTLARKSLEYMKTTGIGNTIGKTIRRISGKKFSFSRPELEFGNKRKMAEEGELGRELGRERGRELEREGERGRQMSKSPERKKKQKKFDPDLIVAELVKLAGFLREKEIYRIELNTLRKYKKEIDISLLKDKDFKNDLVSIQKNLFQELMKILSNDDILDGLNDNQIDKLYDLLDELIEMNEKFKFELPEELNQYIITEELDIRKDPFPNIYSMDSMYTPNEIDNGLHPREDPPLQTMNMSDTEYRSIVQQWAIDVGFEPIVPPNPQMEKTKSDTFKAKLLDSIPNTKTKLTTEEKKFLRKFNCSNTQDPITLEEIKRKNYMDPKWIFVQYEKGRRGECSEKKDLIEGSLRNVTFGPYPQRTRKYYKYPGKLGIWIDKKGVEAIPTSKIVKVVEIGKDKIGTSAGISSTHGAEEKIYTLKKVF
jgi:hypothetical protein